jgi:capsular exopolysaccharide synthesis family protein
MEDRWKAEDSSSDINYLEVIRSTIKAYWPLYAIFIFSFLTIGYLVLRYTSPTYLISSKILIKDEKKTGVASASSLLSEFDLFGGKKIVENELEILKSRPIVEVVVAETHCNVYVYRDGKVRDALQGPDFPVEFIPLNPDSIQDAKKLIHLRFDGQNLILNDESFPIKDSLIWNKGKASESFLIKVDIPRLGKVLNEEYFIHTQNAKNEVKSILEDLSLATTNKNTSVIELRLETKNVKRGEQILNHLVDAYANAAITDKRQIAEFTLHFIEDRLSLVTSQLDSVERDIETYKVENNIVDLSQQGRLFLESVKDEDTELNKIEIQLSVVSDIETYVKGRGVHPGNSPSLVGINEPALLNMLARLYDLEADYSKRKVSVGARDESLLVMEGEIADIKKSLLESVTSVKKNLQMSQQRMKRDLNSKMGSLTSLPGKERLLLDISRQQAIKNSIYTFLLEKREESAISFASTVSDVRMVEPAQGDIKPVRPKKSIVLSLVVLLSILLPSIVIYYKEVLTGKIKFRADIERRTKLAVLGEVLQGEQNSEFIISSDNRSPVAESLRSVRSKMSYYLHKEGAHVVLLSSCLPGEGKSFITTNLGLSLALMGKRTVVIAADMRKPRLHKAFGIAGSKGLSQILVGKLPWKEAVINTEFEHLDIVPPGPIPPNPAELLLNGTFSTMIKEMRETYDYILIDTPPLGLISDAEIMSEYADLSLFVVRHDYSLKEAVEKILGPINEHSKFWPSAVVFNGLKTRGMTKYGRGYGYGGGYGTGYGYAYGDDIKS